MPIVVLAAPAPPALDKGLSDFLNRIGFLLDSVIGILSSLALLVFIYGLVRFIASAGGPSGGDEKGRRDGKKSMLWGIIALFVLFSIWGIIALLQSGFTINPDEQQGPPCLDSGFFGPC